MAAETPVHHEYHGLGIYVHFPWCVRKCPYCDFNSHPLKGDLEESAYLQSLLVDLEAQLVDLPLEDNPTTAINSVFFGGGTPSLFQAGTFAMLLEQMRPLLHANAEVTMEANPGTLEHKPLDDYRQAGINRLSLGAQSFDPDQLTRLGRIHSASDIESSFASARHAGFSNINLDLMYALPDQSTQAALADLQRALELGPEHLSWYQLTLEPKTEFFARPPRHLPGEDTICDMEEQGRALLEAAGYQRYEISAYAREGHRARHNLNYWTFGDYLGIGAGAHGKRSRGGSSIRTEKPRQPRLYMADPLATREQQIAAGAVAGEFLLNALRLVDGVEFSLFEARTGLSLEVLAPRWQKYVDLGLLRADRLATTSTGYRYLDSLVAEFLTL